MSTKSKPGWIKQLGVTTILMSVAPLPALAQEAMQPAPQTRPSAEDTDTITIVGYRAQNEEAIRAKRESEIVGEFLSSDDIGQQPDYNIADSFRRLPGVQTVFDEDEGRYVSVRGLNPSYTLGSLDGSTMATAERGGRQLNMESIPSTAVKRLEVVKSRTPDSDGNAIGGTVNLVTRSPFDHIGLYAAGNLFVGTSDSQEIPGEGYNRSNDDSLNFRFDGTVSTTFGAADEFGVLLSVNYSQKHRDQERILPQAVPAAITENPRPASSFVTGTNALIPTDLLWSSFPNSVDRYGATLKLEYRPSDDLQAGGTLSYFRQDDNELRHSQRLRNQTGANGSFVRFNDFPIEKPLLVTQAWATWTPTADHTFKARTAYSEATFLEPSNELIFTLGAPAAAFDIEIMGNGVTVASNIDPRFNNPALYGFTAYQPYQDDSDEYVYESRIDYGFNTEPGDMGWGFGAGLKLRDITRDNDRTQTIYNGYTGVGGPLTLAQFDIARDYTPIYATFKQQFVDFASFKTFFDQNSAGFTIDRLNTNRQTIGSDWLVEEGVAAVYGLVRHAGERHNLIFGGRWEQTETDVQRWRRTATGGANVSDFTRQTQSGQDENFLPSVTFSYDITDDWKLRLAAASAVGRPNLSSLGGSETVAADGTISRGNANLKAREGETLEGSLEYYFPGDQGILAVGLFQKTIANEIITRTTAEVINGVQTQVNQPVNADSAEVSGIELTLVQNRLEFLPGPLANIGFSANATFLEGETTNNGVKLDYLQGQADFLGNLAIFYEDGPFRARATYAYVSEIRTAVDRMDKEMHNVDVQARYQVSDNVELIGEVRNLTSEGKYNYSGPNFSFVRDLSFYGRQFWVGAAVKY